jgi:hypothetical protein
MKIFINNHKKLFIYFAVCFLLLFFIFFLVKQPLLFNYKFSESSILLKLSFTNETKLKEHVKFLSEINRTSENGQKKVINYILDELIKNGIDKKNIEIQKYIINKREYKNIIIHFKESARKRFPISKYIIGWHYDSYWESPGADDNASAIAGLLEISRILNETRLYGGKDIDLVFYSTEEPPFFTTENMGSFQHAKNIKNDDIELVIVLEMIGYFSEKENSQSFPISFLKYIYPTKGNFIAVVSNFSNSLKTRKVKSRFDAFFQKNKIIEIESINAPAIISWIDFSDHRNYWKFDIPAVMITDTAFYRNKNYHTKNDTYEKLDYKKMKEVIDATVTTVLSF